MELSLMRVNLTAQMLDTTTLKFGTIPLSLLIQPACGLPGDFTYPTDSAALLAMLRRDTELPASVLDRFKLELQSAKRSRILAVEVSERTLADLGYFTE